MAKVATSQERLNELFNADPRSDVAIADSLGVSKQTISAWRNGSRSPKRTMVKTIAAKYNVSEEWLYGWDLPAPNLLDGDKKIQPDAQTESEELDEFVQLFDQLTDEQKSFIISSMQGLLAKR